MLFVMDYQTQASFNSLKHNSEMVWFVFNELKVVETLFFKGTFLTPQGKQWIRVYSMYIIYSVYTEASSIEDVYS